MKKLDTSACSPTVGFPPKQGTWDFLQQAYTEAIAAVAQAGMANYLSTEVYILFGCITESGPSVTSITAGALFYNGEVYLSPYQSLPNLTGGNVLVANMATTQYTTNPVTYGPANADPVIFTDGSSRNVHNIRQVQWAAGASGSGNLSGSIRSDYTEMIPYLTALGISSLQSQITANDNSINTLNDDVTLSDWQNLTFNSGGSQGTWANVSGFPAQYRTDGLGKVWLRGKISHSAIWHGGNTGDYSIMTLPVTPTLDMKRPCSVNYNAAVDGIFSILIKSTGDLDFLSSITFSNVVEVDLSAIDFLSV